jgi:hypothetical protein
MEGAMGKELSLFADVSTNDSVGKVTTSVDTVSSGKKSFRGVLLDPITQTKYLKIFRLEGTDKFILE